MATTKEPEEVEKKTEKVTVVAPETKITEPAPVQTVAQPEPKNNQTALTIAIVSAAVLFFVGLGLGYCVGHMTTTRRMPMNGIQFPGDNDGGRRFYPNTRTQNRTNSGSSSTTTPQTGSN